MDNIIEASRIWPEEERLLYIVPETMYGASVSEYGKRLRELREKNSVSRIIQCVVIFRSINIDISPQSVI